MSAMTAKVVVFANQTGGVATTTTAINLVVVLEMLNAICSRERSMT